MAASKPRHLPGSAQEPFPEAVRVSDHHPDEVLQISIYLRPDPKADPPASTASQEDVEQVSAFAAAHDLRVSEASARKRRVRVAGSARALDAAFAIRLGHYEHPGGWYRGHAGPVSIPEELHGVVEAVGGLDTRPVASPCVRPLAGSNSASNPSIFTVSQVAEIYDFPSGLDGTGQTVGIIELGGGYQTSDLDTFFSSMNLATPKISSHGPNHPTQTSLADVEVTLDIEILGALAPKAAMVVYFGENTQQGFLDTVQDALTDTHSSPSVLSISWGGPEINWPPALADHMRSIIQGAAGVTVFVASGDSGAAAGLKNQISTLFPASIPEVTACGGTSLFAHEGQWKSETAWAGSGGGISCRFPRPSYQPKKTLPKPGTGSLCPGNDGRGVPDVAGNADPHTGYLTFIHGTWVTHGGTSAVAPLWSALMARINQANGFAWGPLNPTLYGLDGGFHDILAGGNGAYHATPGWDAVTGLGSPMASALQTALQKALRSKPKP